VDLAAEGLLLTSKPSTHITLPPAIYQSSFGWPSPQNWQNMRLCLLQRAAVLPTDGNATICDAHCLFHRNIRLLSVGDGHSFPQQRLCHPAGVGTQRRRYGGVVRAQAASLTIAPRRWLGPPSRVAEQQQQQEEGPPVYGVELTGDQWDPLGLHQTVLKVQGGSLTLCQPRFTLPMLH
jgi:hypothetical protein